MSKNFDCRYVPREKRWVVISPSLIALPQTTLLRIGDRVRARWEAELKKLNPITDGSKYEFVLEAIDALKNGRIAQVSIGKGDQPLFTATEGEGKIYG